ncbi:hypothetical protein PBY51_022845 [Eleginops maclovinus]|uniref:CARD domain-containing protein n=1 Tax=Eleginops maclovinus TaxID=56733 RepID=A0AAN8AMA1_ELEMC|nr:hypothetical protein PBY51_022845 [Eleginops maclovinus]
MVNTGTVDEILPSHQGPAAKMIITNKLGLIDCLSADSSFILQNVHEKQIVTDRQYLILKDLSQQEETVIKLIDQVIRKDENSCSLFLEVLKQPDVLMTYPKLKELTKKW